MTSTRHQGPLTESEQKWYSAFEHKLKSLQGNAGFQTAFLDPIQQELAAKLLKEHSHLASLAYGGYPGAERVRLRIFPASQPGILPEVACLLVSPAATDAGLGHRDYLGAVLGLGLRRDQVGDIVMLPDGRAAVMVDQSKTDFICAQLTRVGQMPVECLPANPAALPLLGGEGKEISGTVTGLRLDAVMALGFGISRSRAVLLIKGGLVKVNWRPVDTPAYQLREGDLISLQGRGRLELLAVAGETRKGRLRLNLKKYS